MGPSPRGGTPPQLRPEELRALALAHPQWWERPEGEVTVEQLGRGESYVAWALRRGEQELVARIPHVRLDELPLPPAAELDMLRRLPADLGAAPVAALDGYKGYEGSEGHEGASEEPAVLVVTTRVPGCTLPAAAWTDPALFLAHARTLARLHEHGEIDGMAVPERFDPVGAAEAARDWWRSHEPGSARAVIEPLWEPFIRLLERARTAFHDIEPVLLHGDPAAANCLVDADGRVRLVDWEWAQVGDPARDLALIGGPLGAEPWYAPLTQQQVRLHAEAYQQARPHARLDLAQLLRRREAHLLHEGLFTAAHLHRVAGAEGSEAERARETCRVLREQLAAHLG